LRIIVASVDRARDDDLSGRAGLVYSRDRAAQPRSLLAEAGRLRLAEAQQRMVARHKLTVPAKHRLELRKIYRA
jgi:hypothetical protein